MTPYNNPDLWTQIIYTFIWFIWAIISIIYWFIGWKKYNYVTSLWMVVIGWFIWWACWSVTDNVIVAWISGSLSIEIMHIIKEVGPELIQEKIKKMFNLK